MPDICGIIKSQNTTSKDCPSSSSASAAFALVTAVTAWSRNTRVSETRSRVHHRPPEHGRRHLPMHRFRSAYTCFAFALGRRQNHAERGAPPHHARHIFVAAQPGDDVVADGKAQSGAETRRFRKPALMDALCNACAGFTTWRLSPTTSTRRKIPHPNASWALKPEVARLVALIAKASPHQGGRPLVPSLRRGGSRHSSTAA